MAKSPWVRELTESWQRKALDKGATPPTDVRLVRREHRLEKCPFRTDFERDYTRILHSRAFRRLRHKTQVFISPNNDHICTRLEHSLYVASIANTIAKALRLNTELVAAIAIGHDVGHAPFGHEGERCLAKLTRKKFSHELHSLRVIDILESPYRGHNGLNLTFAVRDGIACHSGEAFEQRLRPNRRKDIGRLCKKGLRRAEKPTTLEGCVVRLADKVAYLGRDLEDAVQTRIIRKCDIPKGVKRILGTTNGEIIGNLVDDVVKNSQGKDAVCLGNDVFEAMGQLYGFSRERIYRSPKVTESFKQIRKAIGILFAEIRELAGRAIKDGDLDSMGQRAGSADCVTVFRQFLVDDVREWRKQKPDQLAVDFIAGMTDSYFIKTFRQMVLPVSNV